ncbi:MAG: hypothetical protein M0P64_01915 [Candidatus Pacebacteria bacterium]|jgi:hypothetical protein|nr:hypothetical protein [Candidatus Paceibacterota bacterium]
MKRAIKYILIALAVALSIIVAMFAFDVCPPRGPWPTPPWCSSNNFERKVYGRTVETAKLSQIKSVNMSDTWGRNYNMGMVETTQANIESSFERVKELGASEVYVHDFHRAIYDDGADFKSLNYKFTDETFWNDFRDQSISENDLNKLVLAAHAKGLKLGIKHNLSFVNIGKYITEGISGNIEGSVAKDFEDFNQAHTKEWVEDYFSKWQGRMIEVAKKYQAAGVDIMSVSPIFMTPHFAGNEELANTLYKKLIEEVRTVFKGQIYVEVDLYGLLDGNNRDEDWSKLDYYKLADIQEVRVYNLPTKFQTKNIGDKSEITKAIQSLVSELNAKAGQKGIKLSVFFAPSSYENAINFGPVEVLDTKNEKVKGLKLDLDAQADNFQDVFESLLGAQNISRINVGNFPWDDALGGDVKPRVSINATFRNKPAEEVVKAWYLK